MPFHYGQLFTWNKRSLHNAIELEMVQVQGIDSIKDILRKHNVPLVRDK